MPSNALRRTALAAVGALLTLPAGGASADPTLPGCFGAAAAVVCDLTVEITSPVVVGTTETTVPVCVGQCYQVPLVLAHASVAGPATVCVSWDDLDPNTPTRRECRTQAVPGVPDVPDVPDLPTVAELVGLATRYSVRDCGPFETGFEVYDQETGRRVAGRCDEGPECDIEQRPICRL